MCLLDYFYQLKCSAVLLTLWFLVKEAQVYQEEVRSPSSTSVVLLPPDVREHSDEPGVWYLCLQFHMLHNASVLFAPVTRYRGILSHMQLPLSGVLSKIFFLGVNRSDDSLPAIESAVHGTVFRRIAISTVS